MWSGGGTPSGMTCFRIIHKQWKEQFLRVKDMAESRQRASPIHLAPGTPKAAFARNIFSSSYQRRTKPGQVTLDLWVRNGLTFWTQISLISVHELLHTVFLLQLRKNTSMCVGTSHVPITWIYSNCARRSKTSTDGDSQKELTLHSLLGSFLRDTED